MLLPIVSLLRLISAYLLSRLSLFVTPASCTDVDFKNVVRQKWFWIECILCIIHCPPFVTGEISPPASMNNIVVYRVETLICALSLTHLYLLWRAFADYMLQDLPSRDSIAAYTGVNFNSTFVLKRMLNSWMAICWISIFYLVVVLVGGYLFRIAEHMHSCLFEVRLALLFFCTRIMLALDGAAIS